MSNNIPVLNLSGIECWMVNLLPFDADHRWDDNVTDFQTDCIAHNRFGIGWNKNIKNYGSMTPESIRQYLADYDEPENLSSAHTNAVARFSEIKVGHYVIMRLRNAHYYIGRVDQAPRYSDGNGQYNYLSWCCHVEKWVEFENEEMLPSEIIGRFSQKRQPTIVRIGLLRQKLLIIQAYATRSGVADSRIGTIPKIRLSAKNLNRSLNYRELEDLVCAHIYRQNPGYMLLPSSCKINHFKYEFTFVKADCKPITCQVKNQKDLPDVSNYTNDTSYEKIYLYSGTQTEEQVEKIREEYAAYSHLVFISPSDLFKTFVSFDYFLRKMDAYYTLSDQEKPVKMALTDAGWREVRAFRGENGRCFKVYDGAISLGSDELYYAEEQNALVYTGADYERALPYIREVTSLMQ